MFFSIIKIVIFAYVLCVFSKIIMTNIILWMCVSGVSWLKACWFLQCFSVMFVLIVSSVSFTLTPAVNSFDETYTVVWNDGTFSENQSSLEALGFTHTWCKHCRFPKSSIWEHLWLKSFDFSDTELSRSFPPQFCPQ